MTAGKSVGVRNEGVVGTGSLFGDCRLYVHPSLSGREVLEIVVVGLYICTGGVIVSTELTILYGDPFEPKGVVSY